MDKTGYRNFDEIPMDKHGYSSGSARDSQGYIPVMTYSRVCGYYQPTQQWNKGKQSEFKDRKPYSLEKALNK